jgi:hypothetical protein
MIASIVTFQRSSLYAEEWRDRVESRDQLQWRSCIEPLPVDGIFRGGWPYDVCTLFANVFLCNIVLPHTSMIASIVTETDAAKLFL